jgi:hypothetical protein
MYNEMIDQTTRGHMFLAKEFGAAATPTVAWQIDPFGHSNTQAWLLSAEAGMDSLFFGRMDYQDFVSRKTSSKLEWLWQGADNGSMVFASELFGNGNMVGRIETRTPLLWLFATTGIWHVRRFRRRSSKNQLRCRFFFA